MKHDEAEYKRGFEDGNAQREYAPPKCNKENHASIRDYDEGYEDGEYKIFNATKAVWQ